MATSIPSIRSNPVSRVLAKREGGSGKGADQFREELAKHEAHSTDGKSVLEDAPTRKRAAQHDSQVDAEKGAQLDVIG